MARTGAPRVTVGIPTFNRAAWLGETIESVLAQTYTGFRLVVSDNASDDETPAVVRAFADERIDYVRSERNLGRIGNLNRLVELADTEFLVLVPDDDMLYPGLLQAAVELLERSDSIGLVHTAFDVIDSSSRPVQRVDPVTTRSPVTIERRDQALERLMVTRWPMCFPSVVYRTGALTAAGAFRSEQEPFCDFETWMRIARTWDFGYVARPLAGFRVHEESATTDITSPDGVALQGRELALLHAQMRFARRESFLALAALEPRRRRQLTTLAQFALLVDRAGAGMAWGEATARAARLVARSPRLLLRLDLWRLLLRPGGVRSRLVRLGRSQVRAARRGAGVLYRRLG